MENTEIWNELKTPPLWALKKIMGGRLKGKTDINPQWRYEALTAFFGPCGVGWKYNIEKLWLEPGSQDQMVAFAKIHLIIKVDGEWSDSIPGIGGSMLVERESAGLHTSDEAYKMAVTDALSVAMKMIGVAADVYQGMMDGNKYEKTPIPKATPAKPPSFIETIGKLKKNLNKLTGNDDRYTAILGALGWTTIEEIADRASQEALYNALAAEIKERMEKNNE